MKLITKCMPELLEEINKTTAQWPCIAAIDEESAYINAQNGIDILQNQVFVQAFYEVLQESPHIQEWEESIVKLPFITAGGNIKRAY